MKPRIPRRRSLGPAEPSRTEPRWLSDRQLPPDLSSNLRSWLLEPGLLTARIRTEAGRPATLHLRSLHWSELSPIQRERLSVESTRCFVREIELVTDAKRWVFAQTLVSESKRALQGWLAALGSRTLGEALSTCKRVVYGPLEFAFLAPSHPLALRAQHGCEAWTCARWARRRWIALEGQRLLLQELILADLN